MTAQEYYESRWDEMSKYPKFTSIKSRYDYTAAYFRYLDDIRTGKKFPPILKQKMLPKP